ncbi:hypothetical protein BJI47_07455 [Rhodococcus sp. 1168]|nr:hypothetical protein BJI47_07455 [Rhodococcus sp. 1168]
MTPLLIGNGIASDACGTFVVNESSMVDNPAKTLLAVEKARARNSIIAVDDVGGQLASLGILPLIEPDLIVLSPEMSASDLDPHVARATHVLAAQAERTGAVIVASGVDSEAHRVRALGLGATFGIGLLYPPMSSPKSLSDSTSRAILASHTWSTPDADSSSPFAIASAGRVVTRSPKNLLVAMSTHIEWQASMAGPETLILGTFQHDRHFRGNTKDRWQAMAEHSAYTGVCGVGMADTSDIHIHRASLDPADGMTEEWNVVVLGAHFCCALSAREMNSGDSGPDRKFDYVISHDRCTVVRCAKAILQRFDGSAVVRVPG